MQWRATHWFKCLPSLWPHHTCALCHFLLTRRIRSTAAESVLRDVSVSLLRFWWEVERGQPGSDISNLFGPPPPSWGGPGAVWSWLVRGPWLAGRVFVCGCCLLLMLFDILAGVLSVWLSRCRGCSDILKGSSVWATVNFWCFLPLSLHISLVSLGLFNHSDQNKSGRNPIVK